MQGLLKFLSNNKLGGARVQHIRLQRETEGGDLIEAFDVDGIDLRIVHRAPPESTILRFIDPYGDTVINQLQLPVLISELHALANASSEIDFRGSIARLVSFLQASVGVHTYVRFLGD